MNEEEVAPGGSRRVWVALADEPLDPAAAIAFVADPAAGATVVFSGTVRDHAPGKTGVTHLDYEAYGGVVESTIEQITREATTRWPILRVAAIHRVGSLAVGEPAVVVAVSAAHRTDAFPAAAYVIDELKHRAPIWKKEHWDGGAEWVREDAHHDAPESE